MSIFKTHQVDEAREEAIIALEISGEETESLYATEFVAKILQGDEDIKAGHVTKIEVEDLRK